MTSASKIFRILGGFAAFTTALLCVAPVATAQVRSEGLCDLARKFARVAYPGSEANRQWLELQRVKVRLWHDARMIELAFERVRNTAERYLGGEATRIRTALADPGHPDHTSARAILEQVIVSVMRDESDRLNKTVCRGIASVGRARVSESFIRSVVRDAPLDPSQGASGSVTATFPRLLLDVREHGSYRVTYPRPCLGMGGRTETPVNALSTRYDQNEALLSVTAINSRYGTGHYVAARIRLESLMLGRTPNADELALLALRRQYPHAESFERYVERVSRVSCGLVQADSRESDEFRAERFHGSESNPRRIKARHDARKAI